MPATPGEQALDPRLIAKEHLTDLVEALTTDVDETTKIRNVAQSFQPSVINGSAVTNLTSAISSLQAARNAVNAALALIPAT